MGGMIRMAGKPYRPIYDEALAPGRNGGRPAARPARILAIGDSVRTDAIGAAHFGIDLFFITGSIHAAELDAFGKPDPEAIRDLVAPSRAHLAGFMPGSPGSARMTATSVRLRTDLDDSCPAGTAAAPPSPSAISTASTAATSSVFDRLKARAPSRGVPAMVLTFEPHPRDVFAPRRSCSG